MEHPILISLSNQDWTLLKNCATLLNIADSTKLYFSHAHIHKIVRKMA